MRYTFFRLRPTYNFTYSAAKMAFGAFATCVTGIGCVASYHHFQQSPFTPMILPTLSEDLYGIGESDKSTRQLKMAIAYAKHGHSETAIALLRECASTTQDPEQRSDIYYELGRAFLSLGKTKEAADCMTEAFKEDSTKKPVLVVGAGSTGCELGYELARHGERVLVIEADDGVGKGATDASSGLLWFSAYMIFLSYYFQHIPESILGIKAHLKRGYPRYIEPVDLDIIVKSDSGIQAFMQIAKYESAVALYFLLTFLGMGSQTYARLPNFTPASHYPGIKEENFWGVVALREARFVEGRVREAIASVAQLATALGARFFFHCACLGVVTENDKVICRIQNIQNGEVGEFPIKHVVYATNADTARVSGNPLPSIKCVSGDHIFIPASLVEMTNQAYAVELDDGRRMFILQEGDRIKIGTTEYSGIRPNGAGANASGIDYLLRQANKYIKTKTGEQITHKDIVKSTGGTRTVGTEGSRASVCLELSPYETALLGVKLTTVEPTVREFVNKFTGRYLPPSEKRLVGNNIPDSAEFAKNRLNEDFKTFGIKGETLSEFTSAYLEIISTYRDAYRCVLELRQQNPNSYRELYKSLYPGLLNNPVKNSFEVLSLETSANNTCQLRR